MHIIKKSHMLIFNHILDLIEIKKLIKREFYAMNRKV